MSGFLVQVLVFILLLLFVLSPFAGTTPMLFLLLGATVAWAVLALLRVLLFGAPKE